MYKLELIWINTKENLFFEESSDYRRDLAIEFNLYYLRKHCAIKSDSVEMPFKIIFTKLDDGSWKKVSRVSGFNSPQAVEEYFLDASTEKRFDYPELKRKWQQENHIAAEVNVLDPDNNVVKLLSSCHGNICVKFGTCESTDGCHIKPTLPELLPGKFPIFHIKELKV